MCTKSSVGDGLLCAFVTKVVVPPLRCKVGKGRVFALVFWMMCFVAKNKSRTRMATLSTRSSVEVLQRLLGLRGAAFDAFV